MDTPADFTLKVTLPPTSGKGAAMLISVMPGYQSGQRLESLKSAMVSFGEALIWTLRCTIAIVDLRDLSFVVPPGVRRLGQSAAARTERTIDEHQRSRLIATFPDSNSAKAPSRR